MSKSILDRPSRHMEGGVRESGAENNYEHDDDVVANQVSASAAL